MLSEYAGTRLLAGIATQLGENYNGQPIAYDGEQWEAIMTAAAEKVAERQSGGTLTAAQMTTIGGLLNNLKPASEALEYGIDNTGTVIRE